MRQPNVFGGPGDTPMLNTGDGTLAMASTMLCETCGWLAINGHAPGSRCNETAVHVDCVPNLEVQVAGARRWTHGRRPIVVHNGSFGDGEHDVNDEGRCWCDATRLER